MFNSLRRLGLLCLAAALATPTAGQHYRCGCGSYTPFPWSHVDESYRAHSYDTYVQPSLGAAQSAPPMRARHLTSEYYTADEAKVLYHPVVVPLDELLRPGEPIALTQDQLERQRAAAERRASPPQPATVAAPPAATAEPDPFADDAPATASTPGQPAADAAPKPIPPQASPLPPAAGPAEPDPFETLEATK